jgi:DNA polymerase-1
LAPGEIFEAVPISLQGAGGIARILLTIHDEIVLECPTEHAARATALLREAMERAGEPDIRFAVPIIVEAKAAATWADAH